jgi:hypothetical protein
MQVEDVITDFCSHQNVIREHDENIRSPVLWGCSHCSHCSHEKNQYAIKKVTLEDLIEFHPLLIEGCYLIDILALADPGHDFGSDGLLNPIILKAFARYLRDTGQIKFI